MRATMTAAALMLLAANVNADPRDVQRADALFREGRALMKAGDHKSACPKLEESYRLDAAAGTAVNLGDCFEHQGKVGSALLAYRAGRKLLKPGDQRIPPVERQIAALEKRVPRLTITLAVDAPEGTTVTRDGKRVDSGVLGEAVPVNPGRVVLVVRAPGRRAERATVTLAEGEARHFIAKSGESVSGTEAAAVSDAPAAVDQTTPTSESRLHSSTMRSAGYVVMVVGAIATTVGVVSLLTYNGKSSEAEDICPLPECPDAKTKARYDPVNDEADAAGKRAAWGLGVGLAAVAGGVALVVLAPSNEPNSMSVRAGPTISARQVGLQLGGAW